MKKNLLVLFLLVLSLVPAFSPALEVVEVEIRKLLTIKDVFKDLTQAALRLIRHQHLLLKIVNLQ
jgi:hypothetical protein